ncbi:ATP-binding cassette domain-containing protein [Methylobacterium organophilum]|nr:ATP-binding cassette domain-containing protein [Methylobacterium organophilum]
MSEVDPQPLLAVEDLSVAFRAREGETVAVDGVSFTIRRGETVALVGESGSGKSVTALAILRLLDPAARQDGRILFAGRDLARLPERAMRDVRGADITMVFQEPMTSLNPLHTIERQIGEVLGLHRGLTGKAARRRILELLELVGLRDAERRMGAYPHELSGGQRQRVMIAMALACEPDLLVADEPTTALDVTVQAQILALLADLQKRLGMAMLFITHDLGIVERIADRVCVMLKGRIVEAGATKAVFADPQHEYTRRLIASEPKGRANPVPADAAPLLEAGPLKVWFPLKSGLLRRVTGHVRAVDGVSLRLRTGETIGVVGESGSGKTTLGLALLRLTGSEGPIVFLGQAIDGYGVAQMRPLRKDMQVVFQDPYGSLSPRMSVADIVAEGLVVQGAARSRAERRAVVAKALTDVGLDPAAIQLLAEHHGAAGGDQRQPPGRVGRQRQRQQHGGDQHAAVAQKEAHRPLPQAENRRFEGERGERCPGEVDQRAGAVEPGQHNHAGQGGREHQQHDPLGTVGALGVGRGDAGQGHWLSGEGVVLGCGLGHFLESL